jgi:hypothetical protein
MSNKFVGAAKFFSNLLKGGKKSGDGKAIKYFKPGTKFEGIPKYQKEIIKARGEVQKKFKPVNEGIANQTKQLRQTLQGMRGERITQSGISKGKDVTPGIYKPLKDKKKQDLAKGGRVGLKGGSDLGMQSVKYGLDNKPEITKLDRIAKFIAKDKKKKNKKFKSPIAKAIKKNKKKII